MNSVKKSKAHYIAFLGVMVALIFVVLTLETYIFMGMLGINPAFLSLPLAIALCMFGTWKEEFVGGTIFGLCSLIIAAMVAYAPMLNPLVSVFPRVLMGITAYWAYHFVSFIINKILSLREKKGKAALNFKANVVWRETVPAAVGGVIGALTNTIFVLIMLWCFGGEAFATAFSVAIAFNSPIEMACCAVLVPIYIRTMKIALKNSQNLLFQRSEKGEESLIKEQPNSEVKNDTLS